MHDQVRQLAGGKERRWTRPRLLAPLFLGLMALALAAGLAGDAVRTQQAAFPLPSPYYSIVGHSGSHNISLLNLPIQYVGVPQVPVPVDVNGDLLPDVTVALNLVNIPEGLLFNPPQIGQLIAPNLEINRLLTAPVIGQTSPPLRLEVQYEIRDLEGGPSTVIRAGYDTGPGGSIPTYWKALLGGLQDFFNPLEVLLDTRPPLPNQWENPTYRGPLSIVGSVDTPGTSMDFDLHYDPLPDDVHVALETDDEGMHVDYTHTAPREVDVVTTINQDNPDGSALDVVARIERMPDNISLDYFGGEGVGDIVYRSLSDGRAPDVGASVVVTPATGSGDKPLLVDADIEALPPEMHAHWEIPVGGPMSFDFDSPYSGIGAIQAEVRDYFGADPASFTYVPTEQQFASYHKEGARSLIRARVEKINEVHFQQVEDGMEAQARIGDGQLPLEVQFSHDDFDGNGTAIDANAIVSPLPSEINFSMLTPDSDSEPMRIHYDTGDSGQTADVDATVRIVEPDTSPDACGDPGVLCADLGIRHLPEAIDVVITNVTPLDTRVAVDMVPRVGGAEPDVFASAVIAQKPEVQDPPLPDPDPIVADVSIYGLPEHLRIRMENRIVDEGGTTEHEALQRAEFHACSWDYDAPTPGCTDTPGRIDAIDFSFRNFLGSSANMPVLLPETPLWVTAVGRGGASPTDSVQFEAAAHITDIAEVQLYTNDDILGIRTDVGGNQPLSALLDVRDIPIVFEEATNTDPAVYHRLDLQASATINPLPQHLDFCFQQKDRAVLATPSTPFTAPCQNTDPFGNDDGPGDATRSPLALSYTGTNALGSPQEFEVLTEVDLNERGDEDSFPGIIDDDQHVRGHVNVFHLPGHLSAFVDSPPDDADGNPTDGPLRVLYDSETPLGADQVEVDFAVAVTDADFLCRDPRPMPLGKMALCAKAVIENLPTELKLFYDPTLSSNNFVLDTSGTENININDLEASLVEGVLKDKNIPPTPEDESDDTLVTSVLVAFGYIHGLPQDLRGTLLLPGTVDISTTDPSDPIDEIEMTVQNFIGPDPLPRDVPDQRAGVPGPAIADQQFTVFQRDEFFRAFAHVTELRGVAFATARDQDNPDKLLDTNTIRVAFGAPGDTLRAYADMMFFAEHNPDGSPVPTSLVHLIGDITMQHVPDEVTLCIRGKVTITGTPLNPTFCDLAPADDAEGAFSFVGDPTSSDLLDIYAFVRFAQAGGSDVLAARVDLIDIPHVLQGTFRTDDRTRVEFSAYENVDAQGFGEDPLGIGSIEFDLADFDITTHGYNPADPLPWGATSKIGTVNAFPADPAGQFTRLHANPQDMHVRGEIHDLQSVLFDTEACEAPSDPAPDSYPYYPDTDLGNEYTCIRAKFQNDANERFDLAIELDKADGTRIVLRDAGLTKIPDLIQATIAKAATLNADTSFRAPCPDVSPMPAPLDCMPPMLRVDTSGESVLFGRLEMGRGSDLNSVRDLDPSGTLADLDALPESGWSPSWGANPAGVRLRVVSYGTSTETDTDDRSAITAGLRIVIPESLTVDQFQTWSDVIGDATVIHDEASDLKFRYVVREDSGGAPGGPDQVVTSIGELAAMILDYEKGDQILASDPDETRGLLIPGELGLTMFMRHHVVPEASGCDDDPNCHDKMFMQVEGRTSAEIDARLRIIGGADASIQDIGANVLNLPDTGSPGVSDNEPSFMLRVEMDKNVGKPGLSGLEEALLCIVYCVQTDIGLESLDAEFDFEPNNDEQPSRRIDAYIVMDGAANAAEIRGYDDVTTPTGDLAYPTGADGNQQYSALLQIQINPLIVFLHIGLNPILGFDLFLAGEMYVEADINKVEEFRINNKILHLKLAQEGHSGPDDTAITTEMSVYSLFAASFLWLFFIPPIPLYVATFFPPSPPPALIGWRVCPGAPIPSYINTITLESADDSEDLSAWIDDPRFIRFGLLVPLVDLLVPVIFCAVGADAPLIDEAPGHPGQPFDVLPAHPLTAAQAPPAPPPIPNPVDPPDLVVSNGQILELCGSPALNSVIVEPGGTLRVATVADTDDIPYTPVPAPPPTYDVAPAQDQCPAGEEGSLELNAGESIDISGRVEGPGASGRLTITADTILVDDNGGDPDGVVQAGAGKVTLQSAGLVDVQGDVLADDLITTTSPSNATGGGGAGHGGVGGNSGADGAGGGAAYGDETFAVETDTNDPDIGKVPTEVGAEGSDADGDGGNGGGRLYIEGSEVHVGPQGRISADGGDGSDNHADDEYCSVNVHYPDTDVDTDGGGPDTDIDNSHTELFPNTGERGSGGGSGGAIYIAGIEITIDAGGVVSATGGDGGEGIAGGGGGGSGGIIKVSTALISGTPDVSGGVGGLSTCPANPVLSFFPNDGNGTAPDSVADATARPEFAAGGDGADEQYILQIGPHSSSTPTDEFFNRAETGTSAPEVDSPLNVPYVAAAQLPAGTTYNEVVLCGLHRPPESFRINDDPEDDDSNDDEDPNDVDRPTGQSPLDPCGTSAPDDDPGGDSPTSGPHQLADEDIVGTKAPDNASFTVNDLANGYWAFYTVILQNTFGAANNSCLDHTDFTLFGLGTLYDSTFCTVEALPNDPDTIGDTAVGIDNTNPTVTADAPAVSEGVVVPVTIGGIADVMDATDGWGGEDPLTNFTGVVAVDCSSDNFTTFTECGQGIHSVAFTGNGSQTVSVRVTDLAGNIAIATDTVVVDGIAPTSTASLSPLPPGSGWYQTAPDVEITGYADNAGGSGAPDDGVLYEWWVDGGAPTPCPPGPTCTVDLSLTTGQHEFHWRAIDKAGNKEDGNDPGNTLQVNVDDADPLAQLLAVPDPENGDNGWYQQQPFVVISAVDQPGASGIAGIFYGIDDPLASTPYPGFFTVPPGEHVVYFRAVDGAGNQTFLGTYPTCDDEPDDNSDPDSSCRHFLVDDAAPTTTIVNGGPTGLNGWHTAFVPVTINVNEPLPGSGINPFVNPSGTFISVDGAPVQPYTGSVTMGEGLHSIVAYAVDVSGQRSEIVRREYQVDVSHPVSSHRTTPPDPARNDWWRSVPDNFLRATDGDQNAGVDRIEFRRNGGLFSTYTRPFGINPGSTLVEWRALDLSGAANHEAMRSRTLLLDVAPPTAQALNGPLLFIRSHLLHILLGTPLNAPLKWRISDTVQGKVHVAVQIHDLLGRVIRTIDHGVVNVAPGVPFNGQTNWDGKDQALLGLVGAGVYYYRIIATDDAGNVALSGESKPITIKINLL